MNPTRDPRRHRRPTRAVILWCCGLVFGATLTPGTASAEVPPGVAGTGSNPLAKIGRHLADARAALESNEEQLAESSYRSALLEGWLLLGSLEIEEGDLEAAQSAFEQASKVSVETRRPRTSLALVLLELGEVDRALSLLRSIVLQSPTDLEARRLLTQALTAAGRDQDAVQELEQLRAVAPDDLENAFLLAVAYLRTDRPDAADAIFLELAEKRPIPQTWVLIGRMQRDYGYYDLARASLGKALEMDPRVRRAHYYLGSIALLDQGRGLLEEAMGHFEAELEADPGDPVTNLYLGIGLVESRRHEEAVPKLEIATGLEAAQRDAYQFLGRAQLALNRPEQAAASLGRALELAQAQAIEVSDGATDLGQSQIASLHYQLALALRRSGDEDGAAPHFEASKKSSAKLAEGSRELLERYLEDEVGQQKAERSLGLLGASALAALGPEARSELTEQVKSTLTQGYFNLGVMLIRNERHARAAELLEQAATLDPGYPRVQYSLGVARFNAGHFARATHPLSAAHEQEPGDENVKRMLAVAWLNSAEYERAAELLETDAARSTSRSLQYAYGLALVRSQRPEEAESVFAELLEENADWPELNVFLGQAHAQQDDFETAISFLERALELDPKVAEAHATLGDIFLRQGRLGEAETAIRSELQSHPEDNRALYTLAVVLDLNRKSDQARNTLRALLARAPRHADGRYLLGKILLAGGDAGAALEQLEIAADLAPEDANVRYQLGQALQKLGKREKARAQFELFRELKSEQRGGGPS